MSNLTTIAHWLDFLIAMTTKEVKARYKHAVLGFLWVILNPVLQMLVIGFIFQFFIPTNIDNYFLFLFSGLLPWNFFSLSILKATPSIVYERSLIQKANFPREAIPLSIVLSNLFHFIISLLLLLLIINFNMLFFSDNSISITITKNIHFLVLIPAIILLTLFTGGLGLLTSALNVKYRDIYFVLQAVVPMWFYATPIIFKLDMLPDIVAKIFYLNPLTAIIETFQWVLLSTKPYSLTLFFISFAVAFLISLIGIYVFGKQSKFFDDWI